jgi:flagellar basal-body rod protein FlgF
MSDGIYIALSGARARTTQIDQVANNLANAETTAYRRTQPTFGEYLGQATASQPGQAPDALWPPAVSMPVDRSHVVPTSGAESSRAGSLIDTGAPLDVALEGEGFFVLQTAAGIRYTRSGHFVRSAQGRLTTDDGVPVLGQKGPIQIPEGSVTIQTDGTVSVNDQEVGRLKLARFKPTDTVERDGLNRYQSNAKPQVPPATEVTVQQGKLESSNVKPLSELIMMIDAQRSFDALQQAITSYRDMDNRAVEVGRPKL